MAQDIQIDPNTGERVGGAKIDPNTGERVGGVAGLPAGQELPGLPAHPPVKMKGSFFGESPTPYQERSTGLNLLTGVGKSALSTAGGLQHMAQSAFGGEPDKNYLESVGEAHGPAQQAGKVIGNAAQFMIPMGGETAAAKLGPMLGKAAEPVAQIGTQALGSGILNKAQGGEFGTGALAGAAGGALGEGMKALAPNVAESAMKVANGSQFGRTAGKALLEETHGISPASVAKSGQESLGHLTPELEHAAVEAGQRGATGSLRPAQDAVANRVGTLLDERAMDTAEQVHPLLSRVNVDPLTHTPWPDDVSPSTLLNLKRGINKDFISNWKPGTSSELTGAARSAYGALNHEFENAVPEAAGLNQRISSLLPGVTAAQKLADQGGFVSHLVSKGFNPFRLGGAGLGGYAGYHEGGLPGAALGGLTGAALSTPEGEMAAARLMHSPKFIAPAIGAAMNIHRSNGEEDENQ